MKGHKLISANYDGSPSVYDDNCPVCRAMKELGLSGEEADLDTLSLEGQDKLREAFTQAGKLNLESDFIGIRVSYDPTLRQITGRKREITEVKAGIPFLFFLKIVFDLYPEIEQRYPPGILGFTLNQKPPSAFTTLQAGDSVQFSVVN